MPETNKFSNTAEGFIPEMGNEKSDITAKYPDAPPCPTLEYKKAITTIKRQNKIKKLELKISIFKFVFEWVLQ